MIEFEFQQFFKMPIKEPKVKIEGIKITLAIVVVHGIMIYLSSLAV
mgnify:FL=1